MANKYFKQQKLQFPPYSDLGVANINKVNHNSFDDVCFFFFFAIMINIGPHLIHKHLLL